MGVPNVLLGALGDYGGSIQTLPLLPGSPAIDAGKTVGGETTDQRGVARPQGAAFDIGAYETQGFTLAISASSTPQSSKINTAFAQALVVTVTPNGIGGAVDGGIIKFAAPGSGASAALSSTTATIGGGQASATATANATTGNYTVSATAKGVATPGSFALTNTATTVATPDAAHSTVTVSASSLNPNGGTIITLQARDSSGNKLTTGGATVSFGFGTGTSTGTISGVTDNLNGTYTATFVGLATGSARTITAMLNGTAVSTTLPTITVVAVPSNAFDVDGNGKVDALTDGILILRYMFAFSGSALTSGALGTGATRTDPTAIKTYLDGIKGTVLDADGDGTAGNALTDGILILRYLFGFSGTTLTSGALGSGATRSTSTAITTFLDGFNPSASALVATIYTSLSTPTATSTVPITIVFNRPLSAGLVVGNVQVTNGPKSSFVSQDASTYTLNVQPGVPGTVTVTIAAGLVHDLANNPNVVSTFTFTFT